MDKLKISFCIPCMGRLHHLKETLPKNIEESSNYNNVEFIVLNYNSADKLDEWMRDNMMDHIKTGKIVYYKTIEPKYFRMSHSKNMVNRLGTGDLLFTLDADTFISKDICHYCDKVFSENKLLIGKNSGNICLRSYFFHKVRGYDEEMVGWGKEDKDFYYRCIKCLGMRGGEFFANMTEEIKHPQLESRCYFDPKFRNMKRTRNYNGNIMRKRTRDINKKSYGQGVVYKNFSNISIVL